MLYRSPFFFKKPEKSGVPILESAVPASSFVASEPVRLLGDVGIGVPTEIRCGLAVLALLIDEGVEPLESFLLWPPMNKCQASVREITTERALTHESTDTSPISVVCDLIQVLLGSTPTSEQGKCIAIASTKEPTYEGNLGAGFRFLDNAPLKRLLTRPVEFASMLLLFRWPNALEGRASTESRRILGVVGVGGMLEFLEWTLALRSIELPTTVVG